MSSLVQKACDAFNQHGKLTARLVEHDMAIEVRLADTGELLTTVWAPADTERWAWHANHTGPETARWLDSGFSVEQVVRIVATSVLDERPKQ